MFNVDDYPVNGFDNLVCQNGTINFAMSTHGKVCVQGIEKSNALGFLTKDENGKDVWEPLILDTDKSREIIRYGSQDAPQFMIPVHSAETKQLGYVKTDDVDIIWDLLEAFGLTVNAYTTPPATSFVSETENLAILDSQKL